MRLPTRTKIVAPLLLAPVIAVMLPTAPAWASSGNKCAENSSYGTQCINLTGTGFQLGDVQAYFIPPNTDYFTNHTWAFELTTYGCDPRGKTKAQCKPTASYYGTHRTGNPPKSGSECQTLSADFNGAGYSEEDCEDYGIGSAQATHGDFPTFFAMPHTFTYDTWICSEVATLVSGKWVDNGAAGSTGVRACAEVS